MVGRSPRCYIPSFVDISPLFQEKILNSFTIYGMAAISESVM